MLGGVKLSKYYKNKAKEDNILNTKVDPTDPTTIPKFVDEMPIPPVAHPVNDCYEPDESALDYHIIMREGKHRFHKDFPMTTIFGYNGIYPGPTLQVEKDIPVKVKWENKLPSKHILPIDRTLHGTMDTPDVRTVVHLHGANVAADSDGHPEAWYSRGNKYTGSTYSREVYEYTNHQAGGTLWYHDHAKDVVRADPGQVTSIIMHFKEHTGDYVWHCHILEHEDNDMMRPLIVEK